jgi:hypothetical protein
MRLGSPNGEQAVAIPAVVPVLQNVTLGGGVIENGMMDTGIAKENMGGTGIGSMNVIGNTNETGTGATKGRHGMATLRRVEMVQQARTRGRGGARGQEPASRNIPGQGHHKTQKTAVLDPDQDEKKICHLENMAEGTKERHHMVAGREEVGSGWQARARGQDEESNNIEKGKHGKSCFTSI